MFANGSASPTGGSEATADFSLENSPAHASAMSRQSSALSYQTNNTSLSFDVNDCHFNDSFLVDGANVQHRHQPAFAPSLSSHEETNGIGSWMSQVPTVNPADIFNTLPSDPFTQPYQDFELFSEDSFTNQELPLFHIPEAPRHVTEPIITESPATQAARRSLYVDKATSTPNDLIEAPRRRKASSKSKKPASNASSPRPTNQIKASKRHACRMPSCDKSFVRRSDVLRHQADVHGLATEYYQCEAYACSYHTKRNDKMKEHCQKQHGHRKGLESFAVVRR